MDLNKINSAEGKQWKAVFNPSDTSVIDFHLDAKKIFSVLGIDGENVKENTFHSPIFKHHRYETYPGGLVEMQTGPLSVDGAPYQVRRTCEYAGNRFRLTVDASFPRNLETNEISVESILIRQECKEFAVLLPDPLSPCKPMLEWHNLNGKDIFFESERAPLAWIFKTSDGKVFEIGTGDDLWRWNIAGALDVKSKFSLARENDCIRLKRTVLKSDGMIGDIGRKFRFTWYFAWILPGHDFLDRNDKDLFFYDIVNDIKWPDSARILTATDEYFDLPCFHSDFVWNKLKKIIRKNLEGANRKIVFGGIRPSICKSAAHLGRDKKRTLEHGNMMALMNFWLWANKQLHDKSSSLCFVSDAEDPVLGQLPSFKGLAFVNRSHDVHIQ